VKEAAARLGCSVFTVYRKAAAGEIPRVYLGTGPNAPVRVPERELEEFIFGEERGDVSELDAE
jgi:excisionase family DNA binding protein